MSTHRLLAYLAMLLIFVAIGFQPAWAQHAHKYIAAHRAEAQASGSIIMWGIEVLVSQEDLTNLTAIASGEYHNLGLRPDGSIVCWGENLKGQCYVPTPNTGFVALGGGQEARHSVALKADGSVVCWGNNSGGQCDVPPPNEDFVAVAAGGAFTVGLKVDGSVVHWGWNGGGYLDPPAPNTDFIAIAPGLYHVVGLKNNGTIVCWGNNGAGQCDVPPPNSDFICCSGRCGPQPGLEVRRLGRCLGRELLRRMQCAGSQQRLRGHRGGQYAQRGSEIQRLDRLLGTEHRGTVRRTRAEY
jgi:hypothetical protein